MSIFTAAVGGWCLRGAISAAAGGDAWWALLLSALGVVNIAIAIAHKQVSR